MATYRFYFLDGAGRIVEAEAHDFAHDQQAIDNGSAICARHGGDAMEIWQAARSNPRVPLTSRLSFDRRSVFSSFGEYSAQSGWTIPHTVRPIERDPDVSHHRQRFWQASG